MKLRFIILVLIPEGDYGDPQICSFFFLLFLLNHHFFIYFIIIYFYNSGDVQKRRPRQRGRVPLLDLSSYRRKISSWHFPAAPPQGWTGLVQTHQQTVPGLCAQNPHLRSTVQVHGEHQQVSS